MSAPVSCTCALPRQSRRLSLPGLFQAVRAAHRQRRALQQLDDRMLADVGITRAQAEQEAARLVWDAPAHWLQRR
ncbi:MULTISPECIES: DUF1127 domain-containing protein [unclassified Meridianimarinicoccus]|uniref:DUF1127 domain-containing protein n=1 Tax=unclassified Meridianimarinicoccus TaxID=2923344 RepID=UPI00186800EB|nr:DUF1127 domain-containing protein [Fluviibacterium sp. MJW13]